MTKVPGILLEAGFLSSKKDLSLLKNRKFLDDYARKVAEGVKGYLEHTNERKKISVR